MKRLRYIVGLLTCFGWLAGQAIANEPHPKPVTLPDEVKSFAPAGMIPIFYAAAGVDAVIVTETKDDHPNDPSADPYAHPRTRWLILLRKEQGGYKEIGRSDKIIACSTCGNDGLDPFVPEGIKLGNGHLSIEQDYTLEPSTAEYKFVYSQKLSQWLVISAITTDVDQNLSGGPLIRRPPHKLQLPTPPLLASFNPGWNPREPGVVVIVDEKSGDISELFDDTARKLDAWVTKTCAGKASCHEIGRQMNGCMALVQSDKGQYFFSKVSKLYGPNENDLKIKEAKDQAIMECKSSGGNTCKVVRSDCTIG